VRVDGLMDARMKRSLYLKIKRPCSVGLARGVRSAALAACMTSATFSARRGVGEARHEGDEGCCLLLTGSGAVGGSSSDGEDSFVSKAVMRQGQEWWLPPPQPASTTQSVMRSHPPAETRTNFDGGR
jgi:hypothetical protein